jgi:hypothetical protein
MMTPAQNDDEAQLQNLWNQAREFERRTFSNVSVTGASGVKLLEVTPLPSDPSRTQVVVRDYAGDELLKNDTVAGWGLAAPINGYPAYATQPSTNGFETTFTERWLFAGFLYSPFVEWSYMHGVDDAAATSECRLEYSVGSLSGPWITVPGSTAQSTWLTTSGTPPTTASGQFTVPLAASGQVYGIRLMQRRTTGSGFDRTYCAPVYLNAV